MGSPAGRRVPGGGAGEPAAERGRGHGGRRGFHGGTGQGLVVSTGILGDLVLPEGAFDPDRADETHKLQRFRVGQSFATNPS